MHNRDALTLMQYNQHNLTCLLIVLSTTRQVYAAHSETCCNLYDAICLQKLNTSASTTFTVDSKNCLLLGCIQLTVMATHKQTAPSVNTINLLNKSHISTNLILLILLPS